MAPKKRQVGQSQAAPVSPSGPSPLSLSPNRPSQPQRTSRLTQQREEDPDAFHAKLSGPLSRTNSSDDQVQLAGGQSFGVGIGESVVVQSVTVHDAQPTSPQSMPASQLGLARPQGEMPETAPNKLIVSHGERSAPTPASQLGLARPQDEMSQAAPNKVIVSHGERSATVQLVQLDSMRISRALFPNSVVQARMGWEQMQARERKKKLGLMKKSEGIGFPRAFDRTHINRWLVAEQSGKTHEELDAISRAGGIMDFICNFSKLNLSGLGLSSATPLQDLPLRRLVTLRLDRNRIAELDGLEWGRVLPSLEFLNLSCNLLTSVGV
jgi:hypothetical protein